MSTLRTLSALLGFTVMASAAGGCRVDAVDPGSDDAELVGGSTDGNDRHNAVGHLLHRVWDREHPEQRCSAVLVAPNVMLTAAHCFVRPNAGCTKPDAFPLQPETWEVGFGPFGPARGRWRNLDAPHARYGISEIVLHPDYDPLQSCTGATDQAKAEHDFALFVLQRNASATPLRVATVAEFAQMVVPTGQYLSFGHVFDENIYRPRKLAKVKPAAGGTPAVVPVDGAAGMPEEDDIGGPLVPAAAPTTVLGVFSIPKSATAGVFAGLGAERDNRFVRETIARLTRVDPNQGRACSGRTPCPDGYTCQRPVVGTAASYDAEAGTCERSVPCGNATARGYACAPGYACSAFEFAGAVGQPVVCVRQPELTARAFACEVDADCTTVRHGCCSAEQTSIHREYAAHLDELYPCTEDYVRCGDRPDEWTKPSICVDNRCRLGSVVVDR